MIWQTGEGRRPVNIAFPNFDHAQGDPEPGCRRWVHVCAWDGHELGFMEYHQVSDHERVCPFHRLPFEACLKELGIRATGPAA